MNKMRIIFQTIAIIGILGSMNQICQAAYEPCIANYCGCGIYGTSECRCVSSTVMASCDSYCTYTLSDGAHNTSCDTYCTHVLESDKCSVVK